MRQRQRLTRAMAAVALCAVTTIAPLPHTGLAHSQPVDAQFTDIGGTLHAPSLRSAMRGFAAQRNSRPAAACDKLTVSKPASWFAADADGNVDTETEVENYARGATVIAPGFKYDCAPEDADIVVIIYNQAYGTDPALVEKRTLQASPSAGVFFYALTTPDNSPLQEGRWRVAFYQGKTPLSTGEILLGGSADVDVRKQVVVQGKVTDLRTGQPVWQARIFVLNPGVSAEDFARNTRREDIYAQTRADAEGQFALWKPLDRNTQYAMLIAADGYKLRGADPLIIGDQAESPVSLDIKLVKR